MSDHFDKRRKLNMIKPGIVMLGINFVLTVCGAIANLHPHRARPHTAFQFENVLARQNR